MASYKVRYWTVREINRICRGGSTLYYPHPDYAGLVRIVEARSHEGITQLRAFAFGSNLGWFDADFNLIEQR